VTIAAIIVENSVSIGSPDPIFSARGGERGRHGDERDEDDEC